MAPQPLSRVNPKANIIFHPNVLLKTPALGVLPMTVISHWARIDAVLATLLSGMLKSDLMIGLAMYQRLMGGEARRSALDGAAKEALNESDYNLYLSVLKVIKPSRDRRNDFAHYMWASSPELPDALLLIDPKAVVKHLAQHDQFIINIPILGAHRAKLPETIDRSLVQVFRDTDLNAEIKAAEAAHGYVDTLKHVFLGGFASDHMRQKLLSAPQIGQAFERLTNGSG